MKKLTFAVVFSGGRSIEKEVTAATERDGRDIVWNVLLTMEEKDHVESIELVEQEEINSITEVKLSLQPDNSWTVEISKTFAPKYGGGHQTFKCGTSPHIHGALDIARGWVTLSPGQRTDGEATKA